MLKFLQTTKRLPLFIATMLLASPALADGLNVGDKAPAFTSVDEQGKPWKSSDHVGQGLVVFYFYPADMTPGCTKQACSYRDAKDRLKAAGISVFGISGDSAENHQLFRKAHNLNFPLLADEDGKIAAAFGVPYGKGGSITRKIEGAEETLTRGVTASRWTFVVDASGNIIHRNTRANPTRDVEDVLNLAKEQKK